MIPQAVAREHIAAKLGEGSLGEVYRATDTKLSREVAIKVLPRQTIGTRSYGKPLQVCVC